MGRAFICIDDIENGYLGAPFGGSIRTPWSLYLVSGNRIDESYKLSVFKEWLLDEFGRSSDQARNLGIWF